MHQQRTQKNNSRSRVRTGFCEMKRRRKIRQKDGGLIRVEIPAELLAPGWRANQKDPQFETS